LGSTRRIAEHAEVRIEGTRRRVAMRPSDWELFCSQVPVPARLRIVAAFKRFCSGCENLPEQVFRRVQSDPHARLEEFIASGIQVIGRRGTDENLQTFFVTEVRIATGVSKVSEAEAPRQGRLPLEDASRQKGYEQ
jgi:hypothetical protein